MKTKKELDNIKERIEALGAELCELTDEELAEVTGGTNTNFLCALAAKAELLLEYDRKAGAEIESKFRNQSVSNELDVILQNNNVDGIVEPGKMR